MKKTEEDLPSVKKKGSKKIVPGTVGSCCVQKLYTVDSLEVERRQWHVAALGVFALFLICRLKCRLNTSPGYPIFLCQVRSARCASPFSRLAHHDLAYALLLILPFEM